MTTEMAELLAEARAEAQALMCDSCRIDHLSGTALDDSGHTTLTYTALYTGRCRIQLRGAGSQALRDIGDQQVAVLSLELQVPVDVVGLAMRDLVTVLDSEFDPDLIGRKFRVAALMHKTHATARRVQITEVTA